MNNAKWDPLMHIFALIFGLMLAVLVGGMFPLVTFGIYAGVITFILWYVILFSLDALDALNKSNKTTKE